MTGAPGIPVISAEVIERALGRADAVAAIESALVRGVDIEHDHERIFAPLTAGDFLLMPTESTDAVGIKVATIAPGNTRRGLPKISAWYLLFDRDTLQPAAIVDGTRLTTLRTPAVTVAAIRGLLAAAPAGAVAAVERLVVLGSGPQAIEHVRTLAAVMPVGRVSIVGRTPDRVAAAVAALCEGANGADPVDAASGTLADARDADVVVTATSSQTPVLGLADIRPDAVVAAIGAHGLDHRELDADLVRAADVVVEARASSTRENGNLAAAAPTRAPANLAELIRGEVVRRAGAPAVFTGVGMAWEDLAVVQRIMEITRRGIAQKEST